MAMKRDIYQTCALENGLWSIENGGVRCYLLEGTDQAVLLDTGFSGGNLREVVSSLTSLPVRLVTTHADPDHIGCHGQFGSAWLHPAEYDHFCRNHPGGLVELHPLWEGECINLGPRKLEVLLLPGHTPGSIALWDRQSGALFSGDTLQAVPIYLFGAGRNLDALICSLEQLSGMAAGIGSIYPSHGEAPLPVGWIARELEAAKRLKAGLLRAEAPERPLPCRLYRWDGVQFYYAQE